MAESPASGPRPAVIADEVHIKYRTFGGRRSSPDAHRRFLRGARRHVGAVDDVHALRGISFVANHGESIGLIGHNGSGKSTLLRAVAGLVPPSSGAVYTDGAPALLGIAGALIRELTGERNIVLGGLALGLTPEEVRASVDDIVEFAGIGDFVQLPMTAYSSGMAARLRFAISTAARPDILMVDEALSTGDADFRARSQERIEEIVKSAGTVFLVSHSMGTIKQNCERVLWLHQGELRMDGPADEVVAAYDDWVASHRHAKR